MQYTLIYHDQEGILDYSYVETDMEIEEYTCKQLAEVRNEETSGWVVPGNGWADDEEHWAEPLFNGDGPYTGFAYIPGHVEVNIP